MKLRLRSLALTAVMMASSLTVLADDVQDYVQITTETDSEVFVLLSDRPCITVEAQQVKVATDNEALLFEFEARPKFEIVKKEVSKLSDLKESQILVRYADDILSIEGLNTDDYVWVYDMSGTLVAEGHADTLGGWTTSVESWKAGVYVVKTEKLTTKIIKK
ncbi:MAG: T9SS type A sorting domain-containing protein [Bacteroides sp.]|nr:T9SS type A sorting domain-containing protein [Bacteroides sp.]